MADKISSIYEKACAKGVLDPNTKSEEWFRKQISTEDGLRSFYDYATANGMKFHPYDEFRQRIAEPPAAEEQKPTKSGYWQSIGAHNPYALQLEQNKKEEEKQEQLRREAAATMPLSQQDKERADKIKQLQTEGTWGKPNGTTFKIDRKTGLPVFTHTEGDGMHLSTGETNAHQDEIDRLQAEQPSYITREIRTPQDLYTSVSEAWSANTPEGQKAKAELDQHLQTTHDNLLADLNKQIADLRQQVANGTLSQEEAQRQAEQAAKNADAIYENETKLEKDYFMRRMQAANADYIKQQTRRLGQQATNQTIDDLNTQVTTQIDRLEKEVKSEYDLALASSPNPTLLNLSYDRTKDNELALYRQSQQFLDDAAKISRAAQDQQGFFRAFGQSMSDIDTWDFGISQLTRSANLKEVVEKYEQGKTLTAAEKSLMDAVVAYMSACAYNSDQLTRRYKAGQTTGESVPFMLQFMVMPIEAIKSKVAKAVVRYGIEQFGGKAAQAAGKTAAKYTAKTAFKEAGAALLGNLAAAGVQTATFGVPKIAEGAISRMTGDIEPTFDENGKITYGGRSNQQGAAEAIYNATVDQYVENLSEMIMTTFDPLKAYAGTTKLLKGLKSTEIAQVLGKMNEGVIGKIRNRAQFRNYLEEVSEEYVGNLMRWGMSTDVHTADEAGFSIDQQIDTWLGLAPTSLFFAGLNAAEWGVNRIQSAVAANRLRKVMEDGEERKYLESLLRSDDNSDVFAQNAHAAVKSILRNKKLEAEDKRFLLEEIYYTYQDKVAAEAEAAKAQAEAEQQQAVRQQAEAEVAPITNQTDGKVYAVTRADDASKSGHIVSGKIEIDTTTPDRPVITNDDVVTVRYADGTVEQLPARDLNLAGAPAAADEVVAQHTAEQLQAEQVKQQVAATFHAGQEVAMTDQDGNTHTSRVVSVSDEGVEVEVADAEGKPNTTIIPADTALNSLQPIEPQPAQEGVEHYRDQNNEEAAFYRNADGSVTLVDEQEKPVLDEQGNAMVMSADEFDKFAADSHLTRTDNAQQEMQPVGEGDFGYIYDQFKGKAQEAIAFLKQQQSGEALGALHHKDIGGIDLVWGYEGTGKSDGFGLAKLIKYHPEVVDNLQEIINDMHIVSRTDNRIQLESDKYAAAVRLTWNDERKTWLLTAFQKKSSAINNTTDTADTLTGKRNDTATPQDTANPSADKGTTISANTQKNIPNIDTMSSDELGAATVEYMGGTTAAAAYLEAERDKAKKEVSRLTKQKVTQYTDIADFKAQNDALQAQKKAATDRLSKLEQALIVANHYKTQAEQEAAAARKAEEEAKRAARRQTEAAAATNAAPAARWQTAPKAEGNTVTRTLPDGTTIKGRYILAEAGTATPSHDPNNGWNTSNGYPTTEDGRNINDRDYRNDKDAQQLTTQMAQTYDGQAVAQVPVVSSEGIVYDGNGRTIAGNIAAANNTDAAYIQALADNAANFGFTPEQVASMQHPRVYMQLDEDLPYNTTTLAKFNAQEKKTQSNTNRAVSNGKKLTEAARDGILAILDNYGSLDAFFASEAGANDIVKSLLSNGIITQQEVAGLTEATDRGFVLSPAGKDYVTDLLIGSLFDEQTIRMLGNDKGLKQSILRAVPSIVENRRLGDYALTDDINVAIRLLYEARKAGQAYYLYIRQVDAFEGKVSDRYSPFEMLLAEEMSSGVEAFRQVLNLYNTSARNEANGQAGLFEPRTIEDIKNEILQHYAKRPTTAAVEPTAGTNPTAGTTAPSRPQNPQTQSPVPSPQAGNGRVDAEDNARKQAESQQQSAKDSTKDAPKGERTGGKSSKQTGEKKEKKSENKNKIFTEDAYEAARRRMHERLNRLNAGLDPEMLSDGLIMAGYHVEKGARKFADFAKRMIEEFGDQIRPYLKSFYNGLRDLPEAEALSREMDDYATVAQFDVKSISIEEPKAQDNKPNGIMEQYRKIKEQYPDALLLFRSGNFYETYAEDAVRASKILNITLTHRSDGTGGGSIDVAGFPFHALDTYLPKIVRAGLRVAICDLEDTKQLAKKLVKRPEPIKSTENLQNTLPSEEKVVPLRETEKRYECNGKSIVVDKADYKTYITDEAKALFAELSQQSEKPLAVPTSAYISFASIDGAKIPAEVLLQDPNIQAAQAKIDARSGQSLELTDEQIADYASRLFDAEHGSAVLNAKGKINKRNGEEDFSGEVAQERKALFVIGRPAGGKSSVYANPLSAQNKARIIDSDVVKPWLDGFDGGDGAGYVQEASDKVAKFALAKAIENGDNIVIPKIGGKSVIKMAADLRNAGYSVELYYNEVSEGASIMRAAARFAETGRYLSIGYLTSIKDKAEKNFINYANKTIKEVQDELSTQQVQDLRGGTGSVQRLEEQFLPGLGREGRAGSGEHVQGTLEQGGLRREVNLLNDYLFAKAEWKNNDVAFGEPTRLVWSSESGEPIPGTDSVRTHRQLGEIRKSTQHTKTGEDIWVVKLEARFNNEEFKLLKDRAKACGGYYSSFAKNRGFIFKSEEDANKFNSINDEDIATDQTNADTAIARNEGETVSGEAASITRDRRNNSGAERESGAEGTEGGVREPEPVELTPEEADKEVKTRQHTIDKIDKAADKINDQLAVLGYYEADTSNPKKFNEQYGYLKTAETKAVKDINRLAKQLASDLGLDIRIRKSIAKANIAPIGGDISFHLPLENSKELYLSIALDSTEDENALELRNIMWRVEDPQANGTARYIMPNHSYTGKAAAELRYIDLLNDIRKVAAEYLPKTNATKLEVAKKVQEQTDRKKKDTTSIPNSQPVLDLFGDVTDTVNEAAEQEQAAATEDLHNGYKVGDTIKHKKYGEVKIVDFEKDGRPVVDSFGTNWITEIVNWEDIEPLNTNINGELRTNGRGEGSTAQAEPSGQPRNENGALGGSQQPKDERPVGGRVGTSGTSHRLHDGERGGGTPLQPAEQTVTPAEPTDDIEPSQWRNTRNFKARGEERLAPTTPKARYEANLAAIRLLKKLQDEDRQATPQEMSVLSQYSGWGGLGEFFKGEPGTVYYSQHGENSPYQTLASIMTPEELDAAQLSRNSAYYTPENVINAMWQIAERLGFKGGNILEGSAGIGNIFALMPESISHRSNLTAVEIDDITAGILAQLYPDATTHHAGFQEVDIPNNSQDLTITNVPFVTDLHVYDKQEKDLSKRFGSIHDFCIAKNVRKLKQGGLGIFITTSNTLDKSKDLRVWLNNEGNADVIGAFRLNNETFGGTNATSDIIVIRKRVNGQKDPRAINVLDIASERIAQQPQKEEWDKKTRTYKRPEDKDVKVIYNDYFILHPSNMGGVMEYAFERGSTWRENTLSCYPSADINQAERLKKWVERMEKSDHLQTYEEQPQHAPTGDYEAVGDDVPYGALVVNSKGEICRAQVGKAVPIEGINSNKVKGYPKSQVANDYNAIKQAIADLLQAQTKDISDAELKPYLRKLNSVYDDFVRKYGSLNRNTSLSFLRNDVQWASIAAIEKVKETVDVNGKKKVEVSKTDLFNKRVVGVQAVPKAENAKDGVILSMQQFGTIQPDKIAEWLGKPTEEVEKEILNTRLGFRNPQTGDIEVRHQYLSGNVREKLAYAEEHNTDGSLDANIEELRKVVPVDIPAHLIEFSIGSTWLPVELYKQYAKEKYDINNFTLNHVASAWVANEVYGAGEKDRSEGVYSEKLGKQTFGHELMVAAMNNVPVVVKKTETHFGSTETIIDKAASAACSDKISQIKDDFVDWARGRMQQDSELADRVQKIYNERFNAVVPMLKVDDVFLSEHLPGQNSAKYSLYPHQQQAVARGLTQPLMLAHEVGTGKTISLISTAMEMRRLGTAKKPMIVVQNATTQQFVSEAKNLYPNAKILTVSDRDRTAEGRQEFYAKIKYNDWDLIIIPQPVFDMIPDSESRMQDFINEKIEEKMYAIEAAKEAGVDANVTRSMEKELKLLQGDLETNNMSGKNRDKVKKDKDAKKEAEKRANAEARAQEMLDRKTYNIEDFDDMGIDALLIDEAHNYKHLGFATMMQRGVKGVDPSYSKRAAALYLKCQSVYERNGHKNVIFATGTPISNTAAEIWTFMKYLMPKSMLKENDIYYFDDFVHNFGKINEQLEFATNGKFKANNRFAQYNNVPELMRLWLSVADCTLTREVGQVNDKVPELEGGKAQDIFLEQSPSLIDIMAAVRDQLEKFERMSGKEKKENSHIPLTMYGIAKRAAIDPRLVDENAADEPLSKTNRAVTEVLRSLNDSKKYNGTVAIFCDSYQNKQSGFNLFNDIKDKLTAQGVPANQIAIIRSEMSDTAKQKIFDAVREGDIRVIMGSTQTLGTGVNIQTRLHTLIHMDAPDRPMDYTQRNGRILRQGNMHKVWGIPVRVLRFGVEDSLDVTSYQRLKTKAGFIDSIMNGKSMIDNNLENRVLDDADEGIYDDMLAVVSGSQYMLMKSQAERDLRKWKAREQQHRIDQILIADRTKKNDIIIAYRTKKIADNEKLIDLLEKTFPDGKVSEYDINGTVCHTADEVKNALKELNKDIAAESDKLRADHWGDKKSLAYTISFNGMPFHFFVNLTRKANWKDGKTVVSVEKELSYSAAPLGEKPIVSPTKVLDRLVETIESDVLSGKQARNEIVQSKEIIERSKKESELMRAREGKPFAHQAELEKAQALVDEYTEKMKVEMKEKEAKYAAQSHKAVDLDKLDGEDDASDDQAEAQYDELDYDTDHLTPAQQLVTDTLIDALSDAGIQIERVSEEEAWQVLEKQQSDNSVRLMLQMEQGTKGQSSNPIDGAKIRQNLETAKQKLEAATWREDDLHTKNAADASSLDAAKIQQKIDTSKRKFENQSIRSIKNPIALIANAVELRQSGSSYYGTFKPENGNVFTLRLSNHNATVSNFDNEGEAEGVSIVISSHPTMGIHNDGAAHVVEYFYRKKDLWNAYGNPLADILGGISHLLRTGEYTDQTGLAQRQEVNIPTSEPLSTPDGTIYGYAKDGKIYLTPEGLNPNTPLHEYTHLWVAAIKRKARDLYGNLQDLFSRKNLPDMWAELDRDPHYAHLSDEAKLSEIIARFSGKRGAERMEAEAQKLIDEAKKQGKQQLARAISLRERMRNLLRKMWNWVGENLFRIKHFGSREEAADRVLYDLLRGTDLGEPTRSESRPEFSVSSPVPPKIQGETTREWAARIAEWRRNQLDQQQVEQYKQLLQQNQSRRSQLCKLIVDKFTAIDNFQQWLIARHAAFDPDTMDMHGDISIALSRIDTFSTRYKRTYIQGIADAIAAVEDSKDLRAALQALNLRWQNFEDKSVNGKPLTTREIMGVYAQARDTREAEQLHLADRGAQGFVHNLGMTHNELIDAVESALPQKNIDAFWDAVYAANQFALDYQLDAGMIDTATRERYTRRYYVPQRGWRERDFDGIDTQYVKDSGTHLYGNPYNAALVRAKGRQSLASDPFALIESIGLTSIRQSEHNKSKQQLLNLLLANESIGLQSGAWTVRQVWAKNVIDPATGRIMLKPDGTPIEAEVTYAAPTQSEREHDNAILAAIDQLRRKELTSPAAIVRSDAEIDDLQNQLIYTGRATNTMIERRTRDEKRQHQVVVLKDGQQYIIELQDEALANAVNGNFGEAYNAYKLINKLNAPAIRYMSGMLTQYNPRFASRNFHRDAQAAFINNLSELGIRFATKAAANIPVVQRTIWQYILADTYKDKESYGGLYGDYLREYFETGAQTGFSFMPELDRMAKDFDKMIKGDNAWDLIWGRGVKGTLSMLTEASELTVRFAQFVTARQLGYSTQQAAKMAKDITVNFNQSGLVSKEMSKYFTFFNATVQGNMRELMPHGKNRPAYGKAALKFGAKLAGIAANFALLGLFSVYLNPDDPDDETWFTEYDRMSYFILFGMKIPVVHFFRMFYAAGVQAALAAQGRKTWKDAICTSTDYALSELIPTSALQLHNMWDYDEATNTVEFDPAKYAQAAAPSVVSPVIDVVVNRDFKGATVYRKKWDEQKKNITTAKRNTPQWAQDVSNTLHSWSGGNPNVPYKGGNTDGWIDIKPNAIEHVAEGYLSGVWESIGHTAGFAYDAISGGDNYKHITNYPFLRDLFRDYSEEKAYNQEYYSVVQKLENYEKRVNSLQKEEFREEKQSDRYKTYREACRALRHLPNPYKDTEQTVNADDINAVLRINMQLNRNLFKD